MNHNKATKLTYLPLLVVVSGAPGSGKTTLARKLAEEMNLLHIERDTFFRSLEPAAGGHQIDRPNVGIPIFHHVVAEFLKSGVSLIIDGTLYKDTSEQNIALFQNLADVVNVHCRADNSEQRFYKREARHTKDGPRWLENHMVHLKNIKPLVEYPLEIDWDIIEVDTNRSHKPTATEIARQLRKRTHIIKKS